jgi:hypothetical protein
MRFDRSRFAKNVVPLDHEGVLISTPRPPAAREPFIMVPMAWHDALCGASGQTWQLALHLLVLRFQQRSSTIKLGNKTLSAKGISNKWRTLRDLERRKLVTVESQKGKSPIVQLAGAEGLRRRVTK